jgi:hypothetical protein
MSKKTFNYEVSIVENDSAIYVYKVTIKDGSFSGFGEGVFLGEAFEDAFEDLMLKVDPDYRMHMRKMG